MTFESLIDHESQKIKKTVLSTSVAELHSFMKCFGSCQFLRGLWMDTSVANIHMRTDAMNLVTTARTIHLPEHDETIQMISMLRKEACSGSIIDLAHIPTQICLAGCLTKASAKADNLITAVKTGRLLDLISEHLWNMRLSCQSGVEHFFTQGRRNFSSRTLSKISFAPALQAGPFQLMSAGTQLTREQKELNTREREGRDATKMASAFAESCIQFLWSVMPVLMILMWMMRKKSQRVHHRGVHRGDR